MSGQANEPGDHVDPGLTDVLRNAIEERAAWDAVSAAFGSLGRAFVCADAGFHIIHGSYVLDEVFGYGNFSAQVLFRKSGGLPASTLNRIGDYLVWYFKDAEAGRPHYRQLYRRKIAGDEGATQ